MDVEEWYLSDARGLTEEYRSLGYMCILPIPREDSYTREDSGVSTTPREREALGSELRLGSTDIRYDLDRVLAFVLLSIFYGEYRDLYILLISEAHYMPLDICCVF